MKSHQLGKDGEAFASEFLKARGYVIRDTNYRIPDLGEIDIVAEEKGVICFVEVKTREEDGLDPFEAVDRRKQRKLVRVAQAYLIDKFKTVDVSARFDVLAVFQDAFGKLAGDLLKDAFGS